MTDGEPKPANPSGLSARELEVLKLMATGMSDREIAGALDPPVSPRTVTTHAQSIYAKLGVSTQRVARITDGPIVIVSDAWRRAYQDALVGFLVMRGVVNPARHPAIDRMKDELQADLRGRYGALDRAALREIDPLPAYAAYYKRFGQRYHVGMQLESVAQKGKDLPDVAALVEGMFVAELRHLILTAGHDLDEVALPLRLEVGDGAEPVAFTAPNGKEMSVKPGDMYVADANGVLSAIITGPSAAARIGPGTTSVLFVVYAPPGVPAERLGAHLDELEANSRLISPGAEVVGREVVGG